MTISKAGTFRNILFSALGKGLTLACVALTSMVVARSLTPSDYGVVGFAGIIIAFLSQFSDMGVANAAIRRTELSQRDIDTALTLKILLSCAVFVFALLAAPFSRLLFDHPATTNVIRILALNFLLSSLGFVPQILLMRAMNYRALMIPAVAGAVAQCILTILLVMRGWSFWSVVDANVGATLVSGIALQFAMRYPIRLRFDRTVAQEYLRFGIPLFGTGVLIFFILNLDNLLVGASMGSTRLGYYALAFTWGSLICGLLSSTVNNVLFPAFSAIQNDAIALRRWYLKTVELSVFIATVANASLFVNAHFFLVTFLGKGTEKWVPAMISLRVLCLYGILRAATEPLGPFLMAHGETKILFRANFFMGIVEVLLLVFALIAGRIEWVAVAVFIAYSCAAPALLPFLKSRFSITGGNFVDRIWPAIPALCIGWLATALLTNSFGNTFLTLTARGGFTAIVVALVHGCFSRFRCFREVGGMVSQFFVRAQA